MIKTDQPLIAMQYFAYSLSFLLGEETPTAFSDTEKEELPWWKQWMLQLMIYAAKNPWEFIYYVLLCLTPFLVVSAVASYYLARDIEKREKKKKKALKKEQNKKQTTGKDHVKARKKDQ